MVELLKLLSSKDADDLFNKVKELLTRVGVDVYNDDGSVKDLYSVISEVVKALNNDVK